METHVKILGLLYILAGGFGGLVSLIFFLLMSGPSNAAAYGPVSGYMVTGWMMLMLVIAVPTIVVGIGLLGFQRWARVSATIIAIFELLNFPLGTAMGVYALWVLMSAETDPLFNPRFKEVR